MCVRIMRIVIIWGWQVVLKGYYRRCWNSRGRFAVSYMYIYNALSYKRVFFFCLHLLCLSFGRGRRRMCFERFCRKYCLSLDYGSSRVNFPIRVSFLHLYRFFFLFYYEWFFFLLCPISYRTMGGVVLRFELFEMVSAITTTFLPCSATWH